MLPVSFLLSSSAFVLSPFTCFVVSHPSTMRRASFDALSLDALSLDAPVLDALLLYTIAHVGADVVPAALGLFLLNAPVVDVLWLPVTLTARASPIHSTTILISLLQLVSSLRCHGRSLAAAGRLARCSCCAAAADESRLEQLALSS